MNGLTGLLKNNPKRELEHKFAEIEWSKKPETINDRNELVRLSLKTVKKVVNNIFYQYTLRAHIGREDLLQEGVIIAIKATENYDPTFGKSFLGYLAHCVKRDLRRYLLWNNRHTNLSKNGRSYEKQFWKKDEYKERIFYFSNDDRFDDDDRVTPAFKLAEKAYKEWCADQENHNDSPITNIDELIAKARLPKDDVAILRLYFGIDGIKMCPTELGKLFGKDRSVVSLSIEKSLRKFRSFLDCPDERLLGIGSVTSIKKKMMILLKSNLSERDAFFLSHYYGIGESGQILMLKEIANTGKTGKRTGKRKVVKQVAWKIIQEAREKVFKDPELINLVNEARAHILSLIDGLELGSLHRNALRDFYCMEGGNIVVPGSPRKSQAKFKSSLESVVGLARLSRDLAKWEKANLTHTALLSARKTKKSI